MYLETPPDVPLRPQFLLRTFEKEVAENRAAAEERLAFFVSCRGPQFIPVAAENTNAGFFHKATDRNGWGTGISKVHPRATGMIITDLAIELTDVIIQVKSGEKLGGAVDQVLISAETTGKRSILFGPNLRPGAIQQARREGLEVFTSFDALKNGLDL
jgi:hypothetical protein